MPNDTRSGLKISGNRSDGGMNPPQSPDLNIIEAVWDLQFSIGASLHKYIHRVPVTVVTPETSVLRVAAEPYSPVQLSVKKRMLVVPILQTKWKGVKGKQTAKEEDVKALGQTVQCNMTENRTCTTNVHVCEQTVRNRLKEMGFPARKAKHEPSVTPKETKSSSQWAEEKQKWTVDGWMEERFRDESPRR